MLGQFPPRRAWSRLAKFPIISLTNIYSMICRKHIFLCNEKAKPRVIEGRKATVLLRMLNLSSNVLLEMVLIEGWTAECILIRRIVQRQFFI